MKPTGLLVSVSVIGAIAVGGAVTGTTMALWSDRATAAGSSVTAGTIGLTVNGSTTVDLGARFATMQPGEARTETLTFRNTGSGRNLRLQVELASVAQTVAPGSPAVPLTLEYRTTGAADCASGGGYAPLPAAPGTDFSPLTGPLAPGETASACLRVRLDLVELPAQAATSTVTIDLRGEQVR
jgi:predicted ribosomally synthesized peptide with SipW-like signal peptide